MSRPAPTVQAVDSGPVPLRDVEAELARLLKEAKGASDTPVIIARMSNLVIYCDDPSTADSIAAAIPEIVAIHPARIFLLIGEPGPGSGPGEEQASVRIFERPAGGGRIAYTEQVILRASGQAVARLPFAVRGLLVGNLPTNLWWATTTPPAAGGALLHDLAEHAEQILYDSLGWTDPARGVAAMANWLDGFERGNGQGSWRVASDLNWRRLKLWRRVLAQALDPATAPGAIEGIAEVLVEHGPHAVVQAWLLASWLASCLGWRLRSGRLRSNVEISWQFIGPRADVRVRVDRLAHGPPEIRRVRLSGLLNGMPAALDIGVEDERRLAVRIEGFDAAPRTVTITPQQTAELVAHQLSDREHDRVFRESMELAGVLAQSLLG